MFLVFVNLVDFKFSLCLVIVSCNPTLGAFQSTPKKGTLDCKCKSMSSTKAESAKLRKPQKSLFNHSKCKVNSGSFLIFWSLIKVEELWHFNIKYWKVLHSYLKFFFLWQMIWGLKTFHATLIGLCKQRFGIDQFQKLGGQGVQAQGHARISYWLGNFCKTYSSCQSAALQTSSSVSFVLFLENSILKLPLLSFKWMSLQVL